MRRNFGQSQILDTGSGSASIAASTLGNPFAAGTLFPLLPQQAVRLFNVSASFFADADNIVTCNSINISLQFFDGAGNPVSLGAGIGDLELIITSKNYTTPANVGSENGFTLAADGDPLIEVVSGLQISNLTSVNGVNIASVQVVAGGDFTNTDAVNAHTVSVVVAALLSFVARS